MSLKPIHLTNDVVVPSNTNNSFLNMDTINAIGEVIKLRGGKEAQIIQDMQDFSADAKEGLMLFNEAVLEIQNATNSTYPSITSQWHDPNHTSPLKTSVNNIKKDIANAKSAIRKAKTSAKNFMKAINPKNGLGAIKALAQFLLCPEESFLKDVMNAFDTVVNGIKNIKPKELLMQAMQELANHLIGRFPAVNNLINFLLYMRRYLNTTKFSGINDSKDLLNKLIDDLGNKWNLKDPYNGFDLINDLISGGRDTPLPIGNNGLNVQLLSNKCSALGKIIAQLEASYRRNNRFDDLITTKNILEYLNDEPELYKLIEGMLNIHERAEKYELQQETAEIVGYHNKSAFSAVLAAFLVSSAIMEVIESKLDKANDKPELYESTRAYANEELKRISIINNIALERLMAFEEGIKNIERERQFFDVSDILSLKINENKEAA